MTERRLPLAFGNTGTGSDADQNDIVQKGAGGLWVTRGPGEIIIPGRYLLRTVYKTGSSLTHTLNALTTKFRVYGQGPGSGGGGAASTTGSQTAVATPGFSGAFFDHIYTVSVGITTLTYTVGLGGAAGAIGSAGGIGTASTTVTYNGVTVGGSRAGSSGNAGTASSSAPRLFATSGSAGTVVGSPDFGCPGSAGDTGFSLDVTSGSIAGGRGGDSVMGLGGMGGSLSFAPTAGTLGGGGGAAAVGASSAGLAGGAGGDGILIIEEYS